MEFLKEILGDDLYLQVETKITAYNSDEKNKDNLVKLVNLSSGNYVGKEKFETKETELKGIKKQLDDANTEIKSYKEMDIEGIKKAASDWETKYNTDTQTLKDEIANNEYGYKLDKYMEGLNMNDNVHKDYLKSQIKEKKLKFEEDKLIGADDIVNPYKEKHPHVFGEQKPIVKGFKVATGADPKDIKNSSMGANIAKEMNESQTAKKSSFFN